MRFILVPLFWFTLALSGAAPSPVADAAQSGDIALVRALIAKKADVNAPQGDGMTALHWAAFKDDLELAQMLLKDQNAGVRIQAIDLLIANQDAATVSTLQTLIGKEDNNYVRMRCQNALRNMNASVGTF